MPTKSKTIDKTTEVVARFDVLPDDAIISAAVVRALMGNFSRATMWRRVRAGSLPQPIRLSAQARGFRAGDIRDTLRAMAERRAEV